MNPLQGGSAATFLEEKEASWVNELVEKTKTGTSCLLHHPLLSKPTSTEGGGSESAAAQTDPIPVAEGLRGSGPSEQPFGDYDTFWVWSVCCVGHGAIPVFADKAGDPPKLPGVPVHREGGKLLDMGSDNGVFKHGFAIMTLKGKRRRLSFPGEGEGRLPAMGTLLSKPKRRPRR